MWGGFATCSDMFSYCQLRAQSIVGLGCSSHHGPIHKRFNFRFAGLHAGPTRLAYHQGPRGDVEGAALDRLPLASPGGLRHEASIADLWRSSADRSLSRASSVRVRARLTLAQVHGLGAPEEMGDRSGTAKSANVFIPNSWRPWRPWLGG